MNERRKRGCPRSCRSQAVPRVAAVVLAAANICHPDFSVHFGAGIALCEAAGCVVTGIEGQPVRTGVGGLVPAADEQTHTALLAVIATQRAALG